VAIGGYCTGGEREERGAESREREKREKTILRVRGTTPSSEIFPIGEGG